MISGKNSTSSSGQLWAGRSSGKTSDIVVQIGESISLDIELYKEDIFGSAAHAKMLHKIGILDSIELKDILQALTEIQTEIESHNFKISLELEDIHTHIENRLVEKIGEAGKKLHTGRSRNDQIAVDTHLFVRRACFEISDELIKLLGAFLSQAKKNIDTLLPGYTHLQVAQPIRLAHHLLAHFWAFEKDLVRMKSASIQASRLPLGCGAMAGVNYANDREFLKKEMGFESLAPNSMDAVASRDHILDFLYACSTIMVHASRICEEIILWNSVEFGFLDLPDELTTGSSIMPQKKNPDLAELIRGKFARVLGSLNNIFITLKSLPLTYNRDLQEDRMPLLDSHKQLILCIRSLTPMIEQAKFNKKRMIASLDKGFATATDLADALVQQKGINFRDAHHIVGKLVCLAANSGKILKDIPSEDRITISKYLREDEFYLNAIDLASSADRKISSGGTALPRLKEQLLQAQESHDTWADYKWNAPDFK